MSLLENHCQPIWGPGDIDFLFQMFSAIQLESTSLRESIPLIYDEIKLHAYRCSFRKLLKIESIIFMKDEITVNDLHAIISTVFQQQILNVCKPTDFKQTNFAKSHDQRSARDFLISHGWKWRRPQEWVASLYCSRFVLFVMDKLRIISLVLASQTSLDRQQKLTWFVVFFTNFLMSYNLMNIMVAKSCLVITSGGCSDVTPLIA